MLKKHRDHLMRLIDRHLLALKGEPPCYGVETKAGRLEVALLGDTLLCLLDAKMVPLRFGRVTASEAFGVFKRWLKEGHRAHRRPAIT